jgi:hypothetical protein
VNLLLLIKKPSKKNPIKFAWPNPPINTTDFIVPLNPYLKDFLMPSKPEKLTLNKTPKKEENFWLMNTEWIKLIPKKSGHSDQKIKDPIF